jgi:hypothetical protein
VSDSRFFADHLGDQFGIKTMAVTDHTRGMKVPKGTVCIVDSDKPFASPLGARVICLRGVDRRV